MVGANIHIDNNSDSDSIIILFDDDLYWNDDVDLEQITFLHKCSYYDCVAELIYNLTHHYKHTKIDLNIYSVCVDNSSSLHNYDSFEYYVSHMEYYHSISISYSHRPSLPDERIYPLEDIETDFTSSPGLIGLICDYLRITT